MADARQLTQTALGISKKSGKLSPTLLSDYAFCHYNHKYDWLRPSLTEIITAYTKLYGKKVHDSDVESGDSSEEEEEEEEKEGEEEEGEEEGEEE